MNINFNIFPKFFKSTVAGGILLLVCVVVSLTIANSPFASAFDAFLNNAFGFETTHVHLHYPLLAWINDGLMAIFFLLVGLEIKRELVEGELSSPKKALLPVFAAFGGAIVPAIIYSIFNINTNTSAGWGIPMATDIAFALGVLSLLGSRVPASLKIFLAALAIVDDLIAILVIAIFYSSGLHTNMLLYAAIVFCAMLVMNKLNVTRLILYIIPGALLWYFVHHSGIHATIAGVLMAITVPTNKTGTLSPLEKLEHRITLPVNFIIMPLFALANTNITFEKGLTDSLFNNMGLGIMVGLLLGKPIGITLTSWIVVKVGWGKLPHRAGWTHVFGLGILGGIGFTMSVFIALLSFTDPGLRAASKFAILVASTLAGIFGFLILKYLDTKSTKL